MKRFTVALLVAAAGCSSPSPIGPASSTVTLSGTVTATNGGQSLPGAQIDTGGKTVVTDAGGGFTVAVPSGRYALMISGAGVVPRVLPIDASASRGLALDAISESGGFDLAFYRQMVRNDYDAPGRLEPLRRWTTAPSFDIQATDDRGTPIDPALVTAVTAAIAATVPLLTGGRFSASFGRGVPVRFVHSLKSCGRATVGPSQNAFIELDVKYLSTACDLVLTAQHETGHSLGFWHTNGPTELMSTTAFSFTRRISARERYHAAIAYSRPSGNTDPDTDP